MLYQRKTVLPVDITYHQDIDGGLFEDLSFDEIEFSQTFETMLQLRGNFLYLFMIHM